MEECLVIITYIASDAQGNELRLAIEGWRKHFKEKFRLVIVGDEPPVYNVEYMIVDRKNEKDGEYRPHLDICNKLDYVWRMYNGDYEGFIWASDDCFPINDFTLADVKAPKYLDDEMPSEGENDPNPFFRNLVKTRRFCEREGLGIRNWITHLPLWFDMEKLHRVIRDYKLTENSYVVENIYYNKYTPEGVPEKLSLNDDWKFGVYFSPFDRAGFKDALAHKKWVCCSVNGWSKTMERKLMDHYGIDLEVNEEEEAYFRGYLAGLRERLDWLDVKAIVDIADYLLPQKAMDNNDVLARFQSEKEYYEEVLKIFKYGKEKHPRPSSRG